MTIGGGLNILDVSDPYQPEPIAIVPFESHSVGFKIRPYLKSLFSKVLAFRVLDTRFPQYYASMQ